MMSDLKSRELSDEVLVALGLYVWVPSNTGDRPYLRKVPDGTTYVGRPDPSRSLDDAIRLVPAGYSIANLWEAARPKDRPWWGAALRRDEPYALWEVHDCKSLSLALCIALLRAQGASQDA